MIRIIIYCFLVLVCLPSFAFAQSVTLNDFLKQVRENHPFFKKEALTSDIELKKQESFLGDQDWVVRANTFYEHEENTKANGFTPEKANHTGIDAALERNYWNTGGQLSFGFNYTRSDLDSDDLIIPIKGDTVAFPVDSGIFHDNGLVISYSHPLLQNKGGVLSRLGYELQDYSVKAADLTIIENQESFLLDVGDRFIDWALLTEQLRILNRRVELANEELDRTVRKRKQNLVDEVDVLRSKDAVLSAEQNLLSIEARWKAKLTELATIAQYDNTDNLTPQYNLYDLAELPSVSAAVEILKQNSRVLNVFRIRIEQLEHQRKGFIEEEKPQLSLDISGGLKGGGEDFNDTYDYDKPQFSAALIFSYPLGNRTANADVLRTVLEKERVNEDMNNVRLELESGLRKVVIQIKELEKVLSINEQQIVVAREKTEAEIRRYNQGRIELTFVIQSQDNEQNVQLIYAQNGAIYHKLLLRYNELMDKLL